VLFSYTRSGFTRARAIHLPVLVFRSSFFSVSSFFLPSALLSHLPFVLSLFFFFYPRRVTAHAARLLLLSADTWNRFFPFFFSLFFVMQSVKRIVWYTVFISGPFSFPHMFPSGTFTHTGTQTDTYEPIEAISNLDRRENIPPGVTAGRISMCKIMIFIRMRIINPTDYSINTAIPIYDIEFGSDIESGRDRNPIRED